MFKKLLTIAFLAAAQLQGSCHDQECHYGANDNFPAPVLTSAVNNNGTITVNGKFKSRCHGNANVIIQFFGNPALRGNITEGQDYLGQTTIRTNCLGKASFSVTLAPTQISDPYLSATATLLEDDYKPADTSMFSRSIAIG